jgi:hypothetical protein
MLLVVIAALAVGLGAYVTCVRLPAERLRIRNMDRAGRLQIDLLRSAAAETQREAAAEQERADRCRDEARKQEIAAARCPESSEERASYQNVAMLWTRGGNEASNNADRLARKARAILAQANALLALRTESGDDVAALEKLAPAAEAFLATDPIQEDLKIRTDRIIARVDHQARMSGRRRFSTVAGERSSVIEATAIWLASEHLKASRPGLVLANWKADARQVGHDRPFSWNITFTDPRTGQTEKVRSSFSEGNVYDYLVKNP